MAAPEASLEALVRDELRAPVSELVRRLVPELVAEALNGHRPATTQHALGPDLVAQDAPRASNPTPEPSAQARRCNGCHAVKPLADYERGRGTCRECRRGQERERVARRQAPEPEPGPPG